MGGDLRPCHPGVGDAHDRGTHGHALPLHGAHHHGRAARTRGPARPRPSRLEPFFSRNNHKRRYYMWYHPEMPSVAKILAKMQDNPRGIAYTELMKVCEHYFGKPRSTGGSHAVFKTPWPGDPRVNIQNDHGRAKPYQVRQVLAAIEKKGEMEK